MRSRRATPDMGGRRGGEYLRQSRAKWFGVALIAIALVDCRLRSHRREPLGVRIATSPSCSCSCR